MKVASPLFLHRPFDLVKGTAIDILHCVFLGAVLNLINCWFDKSHRSADYSNQQKVLILYSSTNTN